MKKLPTRLVTACAVLAATQAHAQITGEPCVFRNLINVINPKPAHASCTHGVLTYIAQYDGTLAIYNTANPENPKLLGSASIDSPDWFSRYISDIKVSGGFAFAAVENSGIAVFDVSDPSSPTLVHSPATNFGRFNQPAIEIAGTTAYITDGPDEIAVFDISTPTTPVELPGFESGLFTYFTKLDAIGDRLYITDEDVEVYDISNPATPQLIGTYEPATYALDIVQTQIAGLAVVSQSVVNFVDLTDPNAPVHLGNFPMPNGARSAATEGELLFVSGYDERIYTVDITQPASPVVLLSIDAPTEFDALTVRAGTLFATGLVAGTLAFEPYPLAPEPTTSSLQTPGTSVSIALAGDHVFMTGTGQHGLQAVDTSSPNAPQLVGNYDWWRPHSDLAIIGDYACTFDETYGLRLLDISNPQTPVRISNFVGPNAGTVRASGDRFYFTDDDLDLRIIDTSGPGTPVVPTSSYPGNVELFAVDGNIVYAAPSVHNTEITITDYSNLQSPVLLGETNVYYPGLNETHIDMAAYNSVLFTASSDGVLSFTDLSNPAAQEPDFYWTFIDASLEHISIHGDILALSGSGMPIQLYRLDDPMHPTWLGSVESPGQAGEVAIANNTLYVASGDDGLTIIDLGGDCEFDCVADVNHDGVLTPTDFTAWIGAYNDNRPECDQNGDGLCTPTDFSAWVGNYNAGC